MCANVNISLDVRVENVEIRLFDLRNITFI